MIKKKNSRARESVRLGQRGGHRGFRRDHKKKGRPFVPLVDHPHTSTRHDSEKPREKKTKRFEIQYKEIMMRKKGFFSNFFHSMALPCLSSAGGFFGEIVELRSEGRPLMAREGGKTMWILEVGRKVRQVRIHTWRNKEEQERKKKACMIARNLLLSTSDWESLKKKKEENDIFRERPAIII